ncbi:MAG: glycosyltransferase family 39 protein [Elusimicrobia bacterium]|nr:glycosyltransferase family 39 protein [Elusimicrobiota bacterium]
MAAAVLAFWGAAWCLPDASRIARVLGPEADTPALRARLESSWRDLHARLGKDILLNPSSWSYGFPGRAEVPAGWTEVPDALLDSARSFYMRSGHEDEPNILNAVARLRPTREGLNPRIYFYGGAYIYGLAAWIGLGAALTPAALVPGVAYYMENPAQLAWLYWLGRTFSGALYLAVTALLAFLGRRHFGAAAGLAAAALWAASPGVVMQASYMKPHIMGTFCTLAAFALAAELLRRDDARWGVAAGAAAGLAMAAVAHHGLACLIVAAAAGLRLAGGKPWRGEALWTAKAAGAFILAFLAGTPYLLTEPRTTLAALGEVGRSAPFSLAQVGRLLSLGLPRALTLPVYAALAVGTAWGFRQKDPVLRLALAGFLPFVAAYAILPHAVQMDAVRYLAGLPLGLLLAGAAAARFGRAGLAAAACAALFAGVQSAVLDFNLAADRPGRSTRDAAGDWLEAEVPAGAELGLLRLPQPSNAPYFRWSRYRLSFIQPEVFAGLPADAALPEWLVLTHPTYDDRVAAGPTLSRYELVKRFSPRAPRGLELPFGQTYGNPTVDVYKRRG